MIGKAGSHLVKASRDASLVVIGRRLRRTPIGALIGPVAHAVLHHATAPVAVVPQDRQVAGRARTRIPLKAA
ncbi:universal stress protein [Streptomyces sp. NPDC127190]|uniref:universal stress protein n=1 Tax=unclassified Streptomyces TaxID=2593676 RepID=UPI003630B755